MRGLMLVAIFLLVATTSFAQGPTPPATFPDLPVTDATVKKLQGQLAACEKEKKELSAQFDAAGCPAKTTPVYCSVDGRTMSFVGSQKCWASLLQNCTSNRYGKVFCADCQDTPVAHAPPVYYPPPQAPVHYPPVHAAPVYYPPTYVPGPVIYHRPRGLFCTGWGIRRRCR